MSMIVTAVDCGGDNPFPFNRHVRVLFSEHIGDVNAVTSQEMSQAVDTTETHCFVDLNDWTVESPIIQDPNWGRFLGQRPGPVSVGRSPTLEYAALPSGQDIRTVLFRGVRGYVLILPAGDAVGAVMNVYPVWVAKAAQVQTLSRGGALIRVTCGVRREVGENVVVPA